jgi:hypothetical protein
MSNKEIDWSGIIDEAIAPEKLIETIAEAALHADTYTKGEAVVADYRTRLAAAQTLLLHRRGRPAEAPEPKRDAGGGGTDLLDLLQNPEYAAKVRAVLDAVEGGKKAK